MARNANLLMENMNSLISAKQEENSTNQNSAIPSIQQVCVHTVLAACSSMRTELHKKSKRAFIFRISSNQKITFWKQGQ